MPWNVPLVVAILNGDVDTQGWQSLLESSTVPCRIYFAYVVSTEIGLPWSNRNSKIHHHLAYSWWSSQLHMTCLLRPVTQLSKTPTSTSQHLTHYSATPSYRGFLLNSTPLFQHVNQHLLSYCIAKMHLVELFTYLISLCVMAARFEFHRKARLSDKFR